MNNQVIEREVKKILVHNKIHYLLQKIKAEQREKEAFETMKFKEESSSVQEMGNRLMQAK